MTVVKVKSTNKYKYSFAISCVLGFDSAAMNKTRRISDLLELAAQEIVKEMTSVLGGGAGSHSARCVTSWASAIPGMHG